MKKLIGILLTAVLLLSVFSLAGCGAKAETLKFGIGTVAYIENVKSADGTANGGGEVVSTVAAVLLDKDGKIVKCEIDCADCTLNFTPKGGFVAVSEFKTKAEKGSDYGMVAYGGSTKEWYEQADAFETTVAGKTLDEVMALVATEGKGTDEVIKAGCTIAISDFVSALEKAITSAKDSKATKDSTLKLGIVSSQTGTNATAEAAGTNEVETTVSAIATDKDGKVAASITDAYQASVTFDSKGVTTPAEKTDIATKLEKGDDYGMVAYGGAKKEWYEQAAAFDAALIGKTSDEIAALATAEGKPVDELVTAGCTIAVSDMVKAAVKAAK